MSNDENKNKEVLNVPNLRFAYSEDIFPKNLSSFLEVSSSRNTKGLFSKNDVLSVSGDLGIVNQIELLGRSYAGESVSPYHIVEINDIVYTKSPLASYPYGIIKTNKYKAGIVSTLYAVYKAKPNCNPFFVQHYFDYKPRINKYLRPIVRIGAKHDMKIGNQEVLENIVFFPSMQEQDKIVTFLDLINKRIETQNKIIEILKSQIKSISESIYRKIQTIIKLSELVTFEKKTIHKSEDGLTTGLYPFYTNEEYQHKFYNEFDYDGLYILANTGGKANFKLVKGKFAVMSDTLVIKFKNPCLARTYINYFINNTEKINHDIFAGSGLKHLDKKAFLNINVPLVANEIKEINSLFETLDKKLINEKRVLELLTIEKQYLLNNLFI